MLLFRSMSLMFGSSTVNRAFSVDHNISFFFQLIVIYHFPAFLKHFHNRQFLLPTRRSVGFCFQKSLVQVHLVLTQRVKMSISPLLCNLFLLFASIFLSTSLSLTPSLLHSFIIACCLPSCLLPPPPPPPPAAPAPLVEE